MFIHSLSEKLGLTSASSADLTVEGETSFLLIETRKIAIWTWGPAQGNRRAAWRLIGLRGLFTGLSSGREVGWGVNRGS